MARRVRDVFPGTVVLLPLDRSTLHCGLAGFVQVARREPFAAPPAGSLGRAVDRVVAGSVGDLASGGVAAACAGGEGGAEALLAEAHRLRRPAVLDAGSRLPGLEAEAAEAVRRIREFCDREEALLEEVAAGLPSADQEIVASRLVTLRDAAWSLESEFLGGLARARGLAGTGAPGPLLRAMRRISSTLDSLDRIEVRGRDSAGILVMVTLPSRAAFAALEGSLAEAGLLESLRGRLAPGDLLDGAVTLSDPGDGDGPVTLSFVRKVAQEVGALGDNVAALSRDIRADGVLLAALSREDAAVVVVAHTRWASNGVIHEANAHPVDNATVDAGDGAAPAAIAVPAAPHPVYGRARGRVFVALNGDVDNHVPLHAAYEGATGRRGSPRVTTDTKVIALGVDLGLREGLPLEEAFRRAVSGLEGSAAVAMISDLEPGRVYVSLRGSGQSIYLGLAPDGLVLSSEVYGLVHETADYLALEGERERVPGDRGSRGTIAVLDAGAAAGPPRLMGFDGKDPGPLERRRAGITTRDVDRGSFPHYFRKEIEQSPLSVAKTIRGKFHLEGPDGRRVRMNLGREILPERVEEGVRAGRIRRVVCVGQGTASVAAAAVAAILREDLGGSGVEVRAEKASELSGFGLREDMADTLVVAVTQSGSTADTNRAVDLARRRGAAVIAIVNRRNSDITRRADGVFHTSDGRDVEMSVASTKAFHSQVAAGAVLSLALGRVLGTIGEADAAERARELRALPGLLRRVLALDARIAAIAQRVAPTRRHWAVIGSGLNRVAAEEIRIKCSELCYKSISADTVEDKKHIDLSSEPLMLVLAAGNPPTVQSDLAKDVAIFQAHKALPVVLADEGDERYAPYADAVLPLPAAPPRLAMLANVAAGHLFAYHAARAVDEGARFFSRVRAAVVAGGAPGAGVEGERAALEEAALETSRRLRAHRFESALGPGAAADLVLLLHGAATGLSGGAMREAGERFGAGGTVRDALVAALTEAVRELERPVDAIRHQAKIVTVGTSRTAERPEGAVFDALADADVDLDAIPEVSLDTLRSIAPAVDGVDGWARYRVDGLDADGSPGRRTLHTIERRGGISAHLPSRAEAGAPLKGTKRGVVAHRRVFIGVGAKDGRLLVIVPLVDARLHCTAMILLHVRFRDELPVPAKVAALGPRRMEEIVNGVSEADIPWTDGLLEPVAPLDLLARSTEHVVDAIVTRVRGQAPTAS